MHPECALRRASCPAGPCSIGFPIFPIFLPFHLLGVRISTFYHLPTHSTSPLHPQHLTLTHQHQTTNMPRNRSAGRAGPARAPARPTAPAPAAPQQHRPATTMAAPPQQHAQPHAPAPAASQGPGLFGQMASTAAYVLHASSLGHMRRGRSLLHLDMTNSAFL